MTTPEDDRDPFMLAPLQAWLQEAITAVAPPALGETAAIIRPSSRMDAQRRLDVYRDAYQARLLECLADDFPALRALLGISHFARLIERYISAHPPRSPSLNGYGAGLIDFCESAAAIDSGAIPAFATGILRDIARIEWATVELIHAPSAAPLSAADLLAREASFAEARLQPVPTLRLMRLEHPVHDLYMALRSGSTQYDAAPVSMPSFELLQRIGWSVQCQQLAADEGALLAELLEGTAVGVALERAAARGADEAEIMGYFQRWLGAGFFAALVC